MSDDLWDSDHGGMDDFVEYMIIMNAIEEEEEQNKAFEKQKYEETTKSLYQQWQEAWRKL